MQQIQSLEAEAMNPINSTLQGKLIAAELSSAAYTPLSAYVNGTYPSGSNYTAIPQGWTVDWADSSYLENILGNDVNQFVVFVNPTEAQVVIAFKGSDSVVNFFDDFFLNSALDYAYLAALAQDALTNIKDKYSGYSVVTDGHSLGGGMAQAFSVANDLTGYGQNSLPIAAGEEGTNFAAQLGTWESNQNFWEVNMAGDIATSYYSGHPLGAGQVFLYTPATTTIVPNQLVTGINVGIGAIKNAGNQPITTQTLNKFLGAAIALTFMGEAHALKNLIPALQQYISSTQPTQSESTDVSAQPGAGTQSIEPSLSPSESSLLSAYIGDSSITIDPDGTIIFSDSNGSVFSLSPPSVSSASISDTGIATGNSADGFSFATLSLVLSDETTISANLDDGESETTYFVDNADGSYNTAATIYAGENELGASLYTESTDVSAAGSVTVSISGDGDSVVLNDATVALSEAASATLAGSGNTIDISGGATATLNENESELSGTSSIGGDNQITLGLSATLQDPFGQASSDDITLLSSNGGGISYDEGTTSDDESTIANSGNVDFTLVSTSGADYLGNLSGDYLGKLYFDTSTGADSLVLFTGPTIELPGISRAVDVIADAGTTVTPFQDLSDYLTDLGDPMSTSQLAQFYFDTYDPAGTAYTDTGILVPVSETSKGALVYYEPNEPGAIINGQSTVSFNYNGKTITVPATNVLFAGNLSQDDVSNVQLLAVGDDTYLTSAQLNSFTAFLRGDTEVNYAGFSVTTPGTASLAGKSFLSSETLGAPPAYVQVGLAAFGWGGTTLIGNNLSNETLAASWYGNDVLIAGSGTADVLYAGEGVDTLMGGTGGDDFYAYYELAPGSALTGAGTGNVLFAIGDISQGTVSGIQTLEVPYVTVTSIALSAEEFSTFNSIDSRSALIFAATGGTYSMLGKSITGSERIYATSADATTLIGNDTASGSTPGVTFIASGSGDDTLKAGDGIDILSATGAGNDALSAGDGAGDSLSASGSGDDTLTAGNGEGDVLIASGSGDDNLVAGNGATDTLSALGTGQTTLTVGSGNSDTLTTTDGGNTLIAGGGIGDTLTAHGGGNTLIGGNGGDIFNIYDDYNTAVGGIGDDTFNLLGNAGETPVALAPSLDLVGSTIDGGGGSNTLSASYADLDISQATVKNIQVISDFSGLALTASEFSNITELVNGPQILETFIHVTTPGTYSLAGIQDITTAGSVSSDVRSFLYDGDSGGGAVMIGNNTPGNDLNTDQNDDVLYSGNGRLDQIQGESVYGDTLTAGSGSEDIITLIGSFSTANAYGNDAFLYLYGSSDTANFFGSSDTIETYGPGNVVDIRGTGATIFGAPHIIEIGGGTVPSSALIQTAGTIVVGDPSGSVASAGRATIEGGSGPNLQIFSNGIVTMYGNPYEADLISGVFIDNGTFEGADGLLEASGAVQGSGTIIVLPDDTLRLDGAVGPNISIQFQSAGTGTLELADPAAMQATISSQVLGDVVVDVACYVSGTRILTPHGEVAIEDLRIGDHVETLSNGLAAIRWIGHRLINSSFDHNPEKIWPVRIMANTFANGKPSRDLWLSPDHAVYCGGVLIPVRHLTNCHTIVQKHLDHVTYMHLELDRHDIILAEGLPCESYLDTGNRISFTDAGDAVQLHPNETPESLENVREAINRATHVIRPEFGSWMWEAQGCAPLVVTGPVVHAVRRDLEARALMIKSTNSIQGIAKM